MVLLAAGVAGFLIWLFRDGKLSLTMFVLLLCADLAGGALSVAEQKDGARSVVTGLAQSEVAGETVPLEVETESGKELRIELEIPQAQYSAREVREYLTEAEEALDGLIAGKNTSLLHLEWNLTLPRAVGEHGVTASWYSSDPELLDEDGILHAGIPDEGAELTLAATLMLQGQTEEYRRTVRVFPSREADALREEIVRSAEALNQADGAQGIYQLPRETAETGLTWYRRRSRRGALVIALAGVGALLVIAMKRQRAKEAQQARFTRLERDYPELVSKLCLYLGAGLAMLRIFARVAADYARRRASGAEERPAYEEFARCHRRMERGLSEAEAYEELGARCALPDYRGLSLMLIQNLKRGGEGLMPALEREVQTAFEARKRRAKVAGEKVTTKLLLPMCMMLGVVIALIMIPAFMSI